MLFPGAHSVYRVRALNFPASVQLLSSLAELAFGRHALIVGQVPCGFRDECVTRFVAG
jgi:hypothetical protein